MREYTKKTENQSRTLDSNPRASRQAPISEILQTYKNGTLGRQSIQRERVEDEELLQTKKSEQAPASVILQRYKESIQRNAPEEDEELLQGKFDTLQREEIDEDKLLQGKFESDIQTEQELIQRKEKPNNTGLPNNLKVGIENLSGYSLDDVKVYYNSPKPAQLHALAYTQGTDIHVAPGQEKHLPHEAWHVVQQKQERVQPTMQLQGVNVNDNEGLEREADVMGATVFQEKPQPIKSQRVLTVSPNTIQRYLIVENRDFTQEYANDNTKLDDLVEFVLFKLREIKPASLGINDNELIKCRFQLKKWIADKTGIIAEKSNPVFGRKIQIRNYKTYKDLGLALIGWIKAKAGREKEKQLAQGIIMNEKINDLLTKILSNILELLTPPQQEELETTETEYFKWFNSPSFRAEKLKQESRYDIAPAIFPLPQNVMVVLKNPQKYTFRTKIATIHDLMKFFSEKKIEPLEQRDETYWATISLQVKEKFEHRPLISQIPYNDSLKKGAPFYARSQKSEEEEHEEYEFARQYDIPMYGRHSLTAKAMAKLTKHAAEKKAERDQIAVNKEEIKAQIKAVGYSIMALWRIYYDHRSMPYHTLHEVMDVLTEFGIEYNPLKRYEDVEKDLAIGGMFGD